MDIKFYFFLLLFITPWIFWWKAVDRARLFEILTFGLLLSTIVVFIDTIGVYNHWWLYEPKLVQTVPHFIPMDYAVLPVGYMLTYQYVSSWIKYITAAITLSAIGAFIIEPLFIHFDIYTQLKWHHVYSFGVYFIIAMVLKYIVGLLMHIVTHRFS